MKRERTEIAIEHGATAKRLPGAGPTQGGFRPQITAAARTEQEVKPAELPAAPSPDHAAAAICPGCEVPEAPHEKWCKA